LKESQENLNGLAEAIRVARMRQLSGGLPVSFSAREAGRQGNGGDCLSERIRMARERVVGPHPPARGDGH
jgi:hypothetical protein